MLLFIRVSLTHSFNFLSGVPAKLHIRIMEPFQPQLLQTRHTVKITEPDDWSSGIDTMTVLSDSDSTVNIKIHYSVHCFE